MRHQLLDDQEEDQLLDDQEEKEGKADTRQKIVYHDYNEYDLPCYVEVPLSPEEPHVHLHLGVQVSHANLWRHYHHSITTTLLYLLLVLLL